MLQFGSFLRVMIAPIAPAGIEIPLRDKGNFIAEYPLLYLPIRACF
ncbi:MAG: hypothetical protein JWQ49_5090 [Edaphobacter sp.]|jgi:hypothetical protein|nr:hypothetical protein [Edaphobacter sp.]